MTHEAHVRALAQYITENYHGNISEALESVGAIRRIRAVLGWETNLAAMDPRLYYAPGMYPEALENAVVWQNEHNAALTAAGVPIVRE